MGELVDDRDLDLVGEVVRVREVLLEGEAVDRDLVRERGPVRAPLGPGRALVEAVQQLVVGEPLLAATARRWARPR